MAIWAMAPTRRSRLIEKTAASACNAEMPPATQCQDSIQHDCTFDIGFATAAQTNPDSTAASSEQFIVGRSNVPENDATPTSTRTRLEHRHEQPHSSPVASLPVTDADAAIARSCDLAVWSFRTSRAVRKWRRWLLRQSHRRYLESLSKDFHVHVRVCFARPC